MFFLFGPVTLKSCRYLRVLATSLNHVQGKRIILQLVNILAIGEIEDVEDATPMNWQHLVEVAVYRGETKYH